MEEKKNQCAGGDIWRRSSNPVILSLFAKSSVCSILYAISVWFRPLLISQFNVFARNIYKYILPFQTWWILDLYSAMSCDVTCPQHKAEEPVQYIPTQVGFFLWMCYAGVNIYTVDKVLLISGSQVMLWGAMPMIFGRWGRESGSNVPWREGILN